MSNITHPTIQGMYPAITSLSLCVPPSLFIHIPNII